MYESHLNPDENKIENNIMRKLEKTGIIFKGDIVLWFYIFKEYLLEINTEVFIG